MNIKAKDLLSLCDPVLLIQSFDKEVPNELRTIEDKVILIAQQDTNDKFWSAQAIERGVKGTHDDYNVIYNSDCRGEYFKTAQMALDSARLQVKIYRLNQERMETLLFSSIGKSTSECYVPELEKVTEPENNFYEALKSYMANKTKDELLEQWEKSKEADSIGPTVTDFIKNSNTMIIKDNRIVSDRTFANRLKNFLNEIRVSDPMSEEELDYLRRVADRLLMYQIDTVTEQREKDYLIRCNLLSV